MSIDMMQPNNLPYWGFDLALEDRPGVPREAPPHPLPGAHWREPTQQPIDRPVLTRAGLVRPTPVFSTALPPTGASGVLRRMAYRIPDHCVSHWALLMVADRVDVVQHLPSRLTMRIFGTRRSRGKRRRVARLRQITQR